MVLVATDIPMIMSGSSEPAYMMTVTALAPEIAATKNKRCAYLIQDFIQEALGIAPKRGIIRFEAVADADLATNGATALQEIQELEQASLEVHGARKTMSRQKSRTSKRTSTSNAPERTKTPSLVNGGIAPVLIPKDTKATPARSVDATDTGRGNIKHRKSIFGFFRRKSAETREE
jgi:hypothetical protein